MLFAVWNDLQRYNVFNFLGGLVFASTHRPPMADLMKMLVRTAQRLSPLAALLMGRQR